MAKYIIKNKCTPPQKKQDKKTKNKNKPQNKQLIPFIFIHTLFSHFAFLIDKEFYYILFKIIAVKK